MKYLNEEYPSERLFDYGDIDIWKFIYDLEVNSEEEEKAKYFWLTYIKVTNGIPNSYLFYKTGINNPNIYKNDLDKVVDWDFNFYNESIFDELDIDRKYDIIILSNILEYTTSKEDYWAVSENLKRLLKKDGLCVCSYMMEGYNSPDHLEERYIFNRLGYKIIEFGESYQTDSGITREIGYAYRKK
jgi:hypothetical protein